MNVLSDNIYQFHLSFIIDDISYAMGKWQPCCGQNKIMVKCTLRSFGDGTESKSAIEEVLGVEMPHDICEEFWRKDSGSYHCRAGEELRNCVKLTVEDFFSR